MGEFDEQVRALIVNEDLAGAASLALREYGAEILGFLAGVVRERDADEVFSAFCERLWRALKDFEGRSSVRTWCYVLARREMWRFMKGHRREAARRVPISGYQDVIEAVRSTAPRSTFATAKRQKLARLRDALPEADRTLLILRIDRNLPWDDIALAFSLSPETILPDERKREAARLRKRYQLVKGRLKRGLQGKSRDAPAAAS